MAQTVTLNLPELLYRQVARRAKQMKRTIEAELLDAAASILPELPADLERDLAQLPYLTDEELWQAARTTLPHNNSQRMQALVQKQQAADSLTKSEQREVEALLQRFDRTMLIRAQAAVLLKRRGHDISELAQNSTTS